MSGGRAIFLDLATDRYFCLGTDADAAFRLVASHRTVPRSLEPAVDRLVSEGVLVRGAHGPFPRPCSLVAAPARSFLDLGERSSALVHLAPSLLSLAVAAVTLRTRPLRAVLVALSGQSTAGAGTAPPIKQLGSLSRAFAWTGYVFSAHNRCLLRSVALKAHLARRGIASDLVFGVTTEPFSAHCWVQIGDMVLNDRVDRVRPYTPIHIV